MSIIARGPKPSARKRRRLVMLVSALVVLLLAVGLVMQALKSSLVYFLAPSAVQAGEIEPGRQFRLGGLVVVDSVTRNADGVTVEFVVTDMAEEVSVRYTGLLPDLFREGQGVITEGRLDDNGIFIASSVLAKHDENYMPSEVADALKDAGYWQEGDEDGGDAGTSDADESEGSLP